MYFICYNILDKKSGICCILYNFYPFNRTRYSAFPYEQLPPNKQFPPISKQQGMEQSQFSIANIFLRSRVYTYLIKQFMQKNEGMGIEIPHRITLFFFFGGGGLYSYSQGFFFCEELEIIFSITFYTGNSGPV